MAKRPVEVCLDEQHVVIVEMNSADLAEISSGLSSISHTRGYFGDLTGGTVGSVMRSQIVSTATKILGEPWQMQRLSGVALEFDLKFSSQVGLVMTAVGVEGHVQVTPRCNHGASSVNNQPTVEDR